VPSVEGVAPAGHCFPRRRRKGGREEEEEEKHSMLADGRWDAVKEACGSMDVMMMEKDYLAV